MKTDRETKAFPMITEKFDANGEIRYFGDPGMTLWDWFAGQALAGYLADPNVGGDPSETARRMFNVADEMMRERKRRLDL